MPVVVRPAVTEDSPVVAELAMKLVEQHERYDPARFSHIADVAGMTAYYGGQTNSKNATVIVAEFDSKIVGFVYVQFEDTNYASLLKSAAWLHDIYIDESVRGHDIGKKLIEASIIAGRELGADKLMLSVAAKNELGRQFFDQMGFRETMIEMMLRLDR